MARTNRTAGGIVSFAAGFGNGYLTGEKQKEEKARQDELDKIRFEENERNRTNFEDAQELKRKEKLLNEELSNTTKPEYKNKTNIAAEGLTTALPKVFADDAEQRAFIPNMVDNSASRNSKYVKDPNNKNYTTALSSDDESNFQKWAKTNNVPFDPSEKADYDMRGYWKDVASKGESGTQSNANDGQTHYPDTYKTPYHKSFSNESKYANADAPAWNEKDQLVAKDGKVVFDERNPAAQGLTGIEKAKHFMENSTPEQQQRYGNFYAQQGLSATGNETFTKGNDGGLAVADKTQAQAKPMWQTMQDRAMTYLTSENSNPQYQSQAFSMIKQATEMKSEEYMQKIVEARKGGLPALLALANGHSNDELPYTDLKVEPTADGKARLAGVDSSTGKPFEKVYDLKDGSIEDQITQDLSNLASPTAMLNGIARKIETARLSREESRKEKLTDAQLKKLDQEIQEGKIKLESLPQSIQLDLQGKRANINQSNAATEASRANTEKTREETKITKSGIGNDKLPNSVREALWYKNATPEQQAIFDQMNDKSAKVTSDGVGGFMINNKSGMFRMDDNGNVTEVKGLDGKAKPQPAKKPAYNNLWE